MSPTPSPASRFADTAFGRIEYLDRGQGLPVLVVHGSPGGHDQGSLMADFLVAAGLRAIIPSRPGYLGSELTDANRSIDGTADAHAALMATLGIDRFAVLCWSSGLSPPPSAYGRRLLLCFTGSLPHHPRRASTVPAQRRQQPRCRDAARVFAVGSADVEQAAGGPPAAAPMQRRGAQGPWPACAARLVI